MNKTHHYYSLDFFRGVCGYGVAITHLYAFMINSEIMEYFSLLFVEFFFVLSGFVLYPQLIKTINKKRFVIEMPMSMAKIQSKILSLLPISPILTEDQCNILAEPDNIVSDKHLSLKDLNIQSSDVEEAMKKWLWRYRDGGEFAKVK